MRSLDERILDALPQTQCTRCGYPDCAAYASAVATRQAAINRCPPGGAEGVVRLAALTGDAVVALDPACGREEPRQVAFIDETWCIGCTLCLNACPTDAIIGSAKHMHTVIEPHCTGCALCLPACPVDCIVMEPVAGDQTGWAAWSSAQANSARARYALHQDRLQARPSLARGASAGSAIASADPAASVASVASVASATSAGSAAPAAPALSPPGARGTEPQPADAALPEGPATGPASDPAAARRAVVQAAMARARERSTRR
jgi:electron transport complex protein RnfB